MATKTPRVAIVDDDPLVLRALGRLLCSAGFDVDTYASGSEFLNADANDPPDCLVLDLNMPQISGFNVQISLAHSGSSTPVVVITANDSPEARSRALRLGAKAFLQKPVDQSTLLAAIGDAIDGVSP